MKDLDEVLKATAELREKNKPAPVAPKPTQEELLAKILEELKKSNESKQELQQTAQIVEAVEKVADETKEN